jgi:hypothetical protein
MLAIYPAFLLAGTGLSGCRGPAGRPAIWTGTPATVTLKPGATAHAVLTVHNAGALCAQAPDLDVPERHRPGPAARVSGSVPVARLSRHVGDARCPGQARRRRAVLHLFLTAFSAPAALLPHYSCHGAGSPFRCRSRCILQVAASSPACRLDLAAAPRVRSNFLSQVIGTRRVATARTLSMLVWGFGAMIRRSGYRFIAYGADRHKRWAGNRQVPGPAQ